MLVHKFWNTTYAGVIWERCDGWYLFGWLPLFIRKVKIR
jgi:hypothetical protein